MIDIDLILKELAFFQSWAQRMNDRLDELGLTDENIAGIKDMPKVAQTLEEITAGAAAIRERVQFMQENLPPVATADDEFDVMNVDSEGKWQQFTMPLTPEV